MILMGVCLTNRSLKWGSKELTTRVKYGVLGTETIPGSVKTRVYGTAQLS